jgi:hypothetical protein
MKRKAFLPVLLMSLFYLITLSAWAQPAPGGDPDATKGEMCPGGSASLTSNISGTNYQWQVNTGNGFENISDNSNYTGTNTKVLKLISIPSSWYGYQYRSVVDGNNSDTTTLTFVNYWTGSKGTAWENGENWSCGSPPDANTDVVIYTGSVSLSSNASCRGVKVNTGGSLTVTAGYKLTTK